MANTEMNYVDIGAGGFVFTKTETLTVSNKVGEMYTTGGDIAIDISSAGFVNPPNVIASCVDPTSEHYITNALMSEVTATVVKVRPLRPISTTSRQYKFVVFAMSND